MAKDGKKIELGPVRRKFMRAPFVQFVDRSDRVRIHDAGGQDVRLTRSEAVCLMAELQKRFTIDALAYVMLHTTHSTGDGPDPEYTAREEPYLLVPCTYCQARVGEPCITGTGNNVVNSWGNVHLDRTKAVDG